MEGGRREKQYNIQGNPKIIIIVLHTLLKKVEKFNNKKMPRVHCRLGEDNFESRMITYRLFS